MSLITTPNIANADDFYADLLAAHEGLSKPESDALNARLILLLANHIGDLATLREALSTAKRRNTTQPLPPSGVPAHGRSASAGTG